MRIETAIKLLEECNVDCVEVEKTQEALWMAIDALKQKAKNRKKKNEKTKNGRRC